jgi:hypothetical protein
MNRADNARLNVTVNRRLAPTAGNFSSTSSRVASIAGGYHFARGTVEHPGGHHGFAVV